MKKEDQDKLNDIENELAKVTNELNEFKESIKPKLLTYKEFLIEAEIRGYVNGANILCLFDNEKSTITNDFFKGFSSKNTTYWSRGNPINSQVYKNGVWAEIIKDELKLNGHFVNVLNGNMSIGGIVFSVKSFKELINELENMNINSINHPALGHVEVADMRKVTDTLQPF